MHYFIIIVIIAVIVYIQFRFFANTRSKIGNFLWIFPQNRDEYQLRNMADIDSANYDELSKMLLSIGLDIKSPRYTLYDKDGNDTGKYYHQTVINDLKERWDIISANHNNSTFKTIVDSINDYLRNNKSVSDFHLMKDIVDRNCDSKEEEINTQIPIPLYMGLVGTMSGILIGILYLWLSGGISSLLNATGDGSGAGGVEALLGGVALAMISSILGIVLTSWGSYELKNAKLVVEKNKHTFLSWIQAKLLPTLSDNVVGAIREMTGNLTEFNQTFSTNVSNLDNALGKVNESYRLQTQLLETVKQITDKDLSAQNLQLFSALKNSAAEISTLARYLNNTNEYLVNVRALNEKLDLQENRTHAIEEMGTFFKQEIENIEQRGYAMANSTTKVNDYLQRALDNLTENTQLQIDKFNIIFTKQGDVLQQKAEEINTIVSELKNLTKALESMKKLENAANEQNRKIDRLADSIEKLAQIKTTGGVVESSMSRLAKMLPISWVKALPIIGGSIITIACLSYIVQLLIKWFNELFLHYR